MSQYFRSNQRNGLPRKKLITGGSPNASHNVFLDTNVVGKLLRAEFDPLQFVTNELAKNSGENPYAVNFITSPFALFEYLGKKISKPPDLKLTHKELLNRPPHEVVNKCFEHARNFYMDKKNFDTLNLAKRNIEMREFVSKEALVLMEGLIDPFTGKDRTEIIVQNLAWDYAMNIAIPSHIAEQYYDRVMFGLVFNHTVGTNFIQSNPAAELMKQRIKRHLKTKTPAPDRIEQANVALSELTFKKMSDHLDRELIHFALIGWHYNTGMPLKTHCLTADSPQTVEIRLAHIGVVYSEYYSKRFVEYYTRD